jgi:hypothetical protein
MSRSINADMPAGTANEEDTMCTLACNVQTDNAVKPVDDVLATYVATDALNSVHCSNHDVFTDVLTAGVFEFETSVGWRWLHDDSESEVDEEDLFVADGQLRQELAEWSLDNGVTHIALGSLLHILRKYHPSLPRDVAENA